MPVKSKINISLIMGLVLVMVTGCATGQTSVSGKTRPSRDPEGVKVYFEAPPKYEVIGYVQATSHAALTELGLKDMCLNELKVRAANLGANGLLVSEPAETRTTWISGCAAGIPYIFPQRNVWMGGKAIIVPEE